MMRKNNQVQASDVEILHHNQCSNNAISNSEGDEFVSERIACTKDVCGTNNDEILDSTETSDESLSIQNNDEIISERDCRSTSDETESILIQSLSPSEASNSSFSIQTHETEFRENSHQSDKMDDSGIGSASTSYEISIGRSGVSEETQEGAIERDELESLDRENLRKREATPETTGGEPRAKESCPNSVQGSVSVENVTPKKSCKKYGIRTWRGTKWLCRDDFVSEKKWNLFEQMMVERRRVVQNVKRRNRRLAVRVDNMKDLITNLKNHSFLSEENGDRVLASISPGVKELFDKVLKGKRFKKYPDDIKSFAMTLHFYSPPGYNYVRNSFLNFLPHPSTMRDWLKHFDFEPGISKEALATVARFIQNYKEDNPDGELYFSLLADEVSIKKQVRWNPVKKIFEGFTDIGRGHETPDNAVQAKDALVFMLVCINSYFKIPIAYYLIHSVTGKDKSTFLGDILHKCHKHEIEVCDITFDGHPSNISMAEEKGAIIYDDISGAAYFKHPGSGHKVYTTLDPCHNLKLIRNTLGTTDIVDDRNEVISFRFLRALVELQEQEGLHAANKLKMTHIRYENDQMKVSLASQSFSHSVFAALSTCEFDHELGFIIGLQNVLSLADDLFAEGYLSCLLAYKISQDHLEMFFAMIRRFLGLNDNPTVWQFKSAIRKLLCHVDIKVPVGANCRPQDSTTLLIISRDNGLGTVERVRAAETLTISESDLEEICSKISDFALSEYLTDVIWYIAGSVVKMLIKKAPCEQCIPRLQKSEGEEASSALQRKKTYGKLVSASEDVFIICSNAEKTFRVAINVKKNGTSDELILATLRSLNLTVLFERSEHFSFEFMSDHKYELTRMILSKYYQIRFHHKSTTIQKY